MTINDDGPQKNPPLSGKWPEIRKEVDGRLTVLKGVMDRLPTLPEDGNAMAIAATDVFVEKAQLMLTSRAQRFMFAGIAASVAAVVALWIAAYDLFHLTLNQMLDGHPADVYIVTLLLTKSATAGAFIVGVAVLLSNLAKALFHEATVLYSRRHALRFGRLYVYVRNGSVDLAELQQAFRWNDEFSTAFKSMNTEIKTPFGKALEIPGDLAHALTEAAKSWSGKRSSKDKPQEPTQD